MTRHLPKYHDKTVLHFGNGEKEKATDLLTITSLDLKRFSCSASDFFSSSNFVQCPSLGLDPI